MSDRPLDNNQREALRWYRQGVRDGETAGNNATADAHEVACFLYQQGAEKLLKAYLTLQGERAILGHSTVKLAERCTHYEPSYAGLVDACRELDVFYIPTRYPTGVPEGAPFEFFTATHSARAQAAFATIASHAGEAFAGIAAT